jgi:hypothetical protein
MSVQRKRVLRHDVLEGGLQSTESTQVVKHAGEATIGMSFDANVVYGCDKGSEERKTDSTTRRPLYAYLISGRKRLIEASIDTRKKNTNSKQPLRKQSSHFSHSTFAQSGLAAYSNLSSISRCTRVSFSPF